MKRRDFIKHTGLASSLVFVPSFLKAFDDALSSKYGYKRLVIIQLAGGNDGLNTIVPYRNDLYYKNRTTLALNKNDILKLSDDVGLHPSLSALRNLYDKGYLSIINNVGYPNPDRSHFRSTDIWQTASASNQYLQSGWIGRFLDTQNKQPFEAIEVDDQLSLAMKGETTNGIALKDPKRLFRTSQSPFFKQLVKHQNDEHLNEHNLGYLYKTLISAESSAKYIYQTSRTFTSTQTYPDNPFAKQLKTIAQLINSGLSTNVYFTSLGGFDTHANQPNTQKRLLSQYAESVESFVEDLQQQNQFKDTLILTFSEFGRRVEQNAANGTDHGAANNIFLIGENLKTKGLYNGLANLDDLDDNGDLKFEIDFRQVYATILSDWLQVNDKTILNQSFPKLHLV